MHLHWFFFSRPYIRIVVLVRKNPVALRAIRIVRFLIFEFSLWNRLRRLVSAATQTYKTRSITRVHTEQQRKQSTKAASSPVLLPRQTFAFFLRRQHYSSDGTLKFPRSRRRGSERVPCPEKGRAPIDRAVKIEPGRERDESASRFPQHSTGSRARPCFVQLLFQLSGSRRSFWCLVVSLSRGAVRRQNDHLYPLYERRRWSARCLLSASGERGAD
jgi:hypothetical protein